MHWTLPHDDGSTTLVEVACHKVTEEPSIRGVVVNLHDVTEQQWLQHELAESTGHDQLTGLPTRSAMRELTRHAVERATGADTLVGKLHLDVDDFVAINDQYGYDVGDSVLQELAQRLSKAVPPDATAARLGGDAFAVLIENAPNAAAVDELGPAGRGRADRADSGRGRASGLHRQCWCRDDCRRLTASTSSCAKPTSPYGQLRAMGKGHIRHYDPSMHNEAKDRLELQSALERALGR